MAYLNDGNFDCSSKDDEFNIKIYTHFFCQADSKYISIILVCNFVSDCSDNEDEKSCSKHENIYLKKKKFFFHNVSL